MEKSRAIELLKLAVPIKALTQQEYADFVEAVNMGMDALEQPTSPDTIDRKAALDVLRRCQTYLYDARDPELKIELSSAEAAINNLPTIQPEKEQLSREGATSDLISKTETVEHLRRMLEATVPNTDYDEGFVDGVEFGVSTVSTMPTIQPQSTTGQLNDGAQSTNLIDRQETIDRFNVIRPVDPKKDEYTKGIDVGIAMCVVAVKDQPTIQPVATDTNVGDKISKFIDGLEEIFADLREKHVDDSVCGLCEYDGAYIGQSGDWCNECPGFERDDCFKLSDKTRKEWTDEIIKALPTVQPERKKGEWSDGYRWQRCSLCKQTGKEIMELLPELRSENGNIKINQKENKQ